MKDKSQTLWDLIQPNAEKYRDMIFESLKDDKDDGKALLAKLRQELEPIKSQIEALGATVDTCISLMMIAAVAAVKITSEECKKREGESQTIAE